MKFKLTTTELQYIAIALICNDAEVLAEGRETVDELLDLFSDLNNLCSPENDYTISLEVKS